MKQRYASLIHLKPEKRALYEELHANAWPDVLETLKKANVRNYSIFLRDGLLFSYLEYHGTDYDADMGIIAKNPATQKWWELPDPCQQPIASAQEGEWWAPMREVFHMD